jgi:hypothetical protein
MTEQTESPAKKPVPPIRKTFEQEQYENLGTAGDRTLLGRACLARKIIVFQKLASHITKDKKNPHFGYKYASDESVMEAVNDAAVEARIATRFEYELVEDAEEIPRFKDGKPTGVTEQRVLMRAKLFFIDPDTGFEHLQATAFGGGMDPGDKATMKGQTSAKKYAWIAAANAASGDDPEEGKSDASARAEGKMAQAAPPPPAQKPVAAITTMLAEFDQAAAKLMSFTDIAELASTYWQMALRVNGKEEFLKAKKKAFENLVVVKGQAPLLEPPNFPDALLDFYALDEAARHDKETMTAIYRKLGPTVAQITGDRTHWDLYGSALSGELGYSTKKESKKKTPAPQPEQASA